METWNTKCMEDKLGGKANWYASAPTLSKISKGPINLVLNFLFFSNLNISLVREAFGNTSLNENSKLHLFLPV
jgi:hypothetical protein